MEDERPVHVVHDVSTGATTSVPLTDEEWAVQQARDAAAGTGRGVAPEDAELRAVIAADPSPAVQALAKKLGLA